MPKRFTDQDVKKLTIRGSCGIESQIGGRKISSKIGDSGAKHNLEPAAGDESVLPARLQIKSAGKVRVRVRFYRRRLADYSRAISEKAVIDCLQYAGLITGDSEKEIWLEDEGQFQVDSKEDERTEIVLEYPEVDLDNLWEEDKRSDGR